jgi:hypothetical protein
MKTCASSRQYIQLSGELHAASALPLGKVPSVPIVQETIWVIESVWALSRREKSFAPAEKQTPAVQHVARRYTDRAMHSGPGEG